MFKTVVYNLVVMCWLSFVLLALSYSDVVKANTRLALCQLSDDDTDWLKQSRQAWLLLTNSLPLIKQKADFSAILYDKSCQVKLRQALNAGSWHLGEVKPHHGRIALPSGEYLPAAVNAFTSFAIEETQEPPFYLMALPSVWQSAGYPTKIELGHFLTAVLLHELSHGYYAEFYTQKLLGFYQKYPELKGYNEDSIQYLFQTNKGFSLSLKREQELLLKAARSKTREQALRHLRQARERIKKRHDVWLSGQYQSLQYAEDLWLTMEGMGQWFGYSWLTHKQGPGIGHYTALEAYGLKGDVWSQSLGFALFLAAENILSLEQKSRLLQGQATILALVDEVLINDR